MSRYSSRIADLERRLAVPGTLTRQEQIERAELVTAAAMRVEAVMCRMAPTWAEKTRAYESPPASAERSIALFEEARRNWPQRREALLDRLRALTGDSDPDWLTRVARLESEAAAPSRKRPQREQAGHPQKGR